VSRPAERARAAASRAAGPLALLAKLAVGAVLAAAPWALGDYGLALLTEVLVYALFAMSLDVVLGYAGLVSLGHAAFFGIGGYGYALLASYGWPWGAAAAGAVAAAGAGAVLFGAVALRGRGVGFILLTFALAQLLHAVVFKADWAGGSNGLVGVPRPGVAGGDAGFYGLVLLTVAVAAWLLGRVVDSPVGRTLVGTRENPARMSAMGYDVNRCRLAAVVVGALAAGLAGVLYAAYAGYIGPGSLDWHASGEALVMVIFGGVGTLRGPAAGAALYILLREGISGVTEHWMLVLGAVFVGFVVAAPDGLAGLTRRALARLRGAEKG
jgi:branched-chain amino acid transport system permease protein